MQTLKRFQQNLLSITQTLQLQIMEVVVVYGQFQQELHMQYLKYGVVARLVTADVVAKWDIHHQVEHTVKKH